MSHPLSAESQTEETVDSSNILLPQKLSNFYSWTNNSEIHDQFDGEQWKQNGSTHGNRFRSKCDLNSALMAIEAFLVILTIVSPVFILLVPSVWTNRSSYPVESRGKCRTMCEVRILSICVKYIIMCSALVYVYSARLGSTFCCTWKCVNSSFGFYHSRALESVNKTYLERRIVSSPFESDRQNFPVYLMMDFLMAIATFVYWIHLISKWHLQVIKMELKTKVKPFVAQNPFSKSEVEYARKNEILNVALIDASDFVNAQLFIQIAGALFLKVWQTSYGSARFIVHVMRTPDCFHGTYRIGLLDVYSAAIHIIQNVSTEARVNDPLTAHKRRRNRRSTVEKNTVSKSEATVQGQKCTPHNPSGNAEQGKRRPKCKSRNAIKFYNVDDQPQTSASPPAINNADVDDAQSCTTPMTLCLGTIDERQLNSAAAARMNLQADYDFLLLKRQTRLKLLVTHWFQAVKCTDQSEIEKGTRKNQLVHNRHATQLVYENISEPLLKYLRFTGQNNQHNETSIYNRLSLYLACNMKADAFLSPFFQSRPTLIRDPQLEYWLTDRVPEASRNPSSCRPFPLKTRLINTTGDDQPNPMSSVDVRSNKDGTMTHQTWKLRIRKSISVKKHNLSIHSFIHHGLRFELVRADVTLLCTVYRLPTLQLNASTLIPSWWSRVIPQSQSMPASTIETCLGSSENFMEIRL